MLRESLAGALDALAGQVPSPPSEVVVAANRPLPEGNRNAIVSRWRDRLPVVRVVDASARRGVGYARNQGIAAATGDFVAICDDDDVVDPGWLESLVSVAPTGHLVGGALTPGRPGAGDDSLDRPATGLPVALDFLPFVVGANFGAWRSVLEDLGGFAEDWPAGGEDVELSWRAQSAGYRVAFAPGAVVATGERPSLRAVARQAYDYGRADPRLFREFRGEGMPRSSVRGAARSWWVTARELPAARRDLERRRRAVRRAAYRTGRLRGSLAARVIFL